MKTWFLSQSTFVKKILSFSFSFAVFLGAFFFYDKVIEENSSKSWSELVIKSFIVTSIFELLFNSVFKLPGRPWKKSPDEREA